RQGVPRHARRAARLRRGGDAAAAERAHERRHAALRAGILQELWPHGRKAGSRARGCHRHAPGADEPRRRDRLLGRRRPPLGDPAAGDLRHRGAHGRHEHRGGLGMRLAIKNARIIDPASGRDGVGDLHVADGKISEEHARPDRVIDAKGLVAAPGFIDLSARLREPGFEYKATLESELEAALAGGVTSLACPPDTDPPLDEPGLVDMLRRRAKALSRVRVYPLGALTVKLEGERLTEMAQLAEAGCVAFSQGNAPVADTQILWRALQYAATFGFRVWLRPEDAWLAKGGVAHDGEVATRLGLPGIPSFAETIALGLMLELVRATGARVHFCRVSTAGAVGMVRTAKREGLAVTCDVAIHHLHLCELDLG